MISGLLVCSLLTLVGCDRDASDSGDDQSGANKLALKLVIPSHKSTPDVDLTYRVGPVEESDLDALKAPVGNVVYLALRDCPKAFPDKTDVHFVALDFVIDSGKATEPRKRKVQRKEEGETIGSAARKCVLQGVEGRSVEFPKEAQGLADRRLEVEAQAKLYWADASPEE